MVCIDAHGPGVRMPGARVLARACAVAAIVAAALLLWTPAVRAQAGQWFTTPSLLKAFFASSERVSFVTIDGAAVAARGVPTKKKQHHVYVAWTKDHVDGYAIVDEEQGQHEPITFGVQVDPSLAIARVEVMAYREAYGAEIRSPRYRAQWIGRTLADFSAAGRVDVDAISGATISCRSTAVAVRRALVLATLAAAQVKATTPTPSTSSSSTTAVGTP